MTFRSKYRNRAVPRLAGPVAKLSAVSVVAIALSGCSSAITGGEQITAWSITDHAQRHPILVSKQPANLTLHVPRGAYGLAPAQRAKLLGFLSRYRAQDSGNSKIRIKAPSGASNEVAAMHAVHEIRRHIEQAGFDGTTVSVEAYHDDSDHQPPVRLSYMRYVAEGPECGSWDKNLSQSPRNMAYPDFGCADQRNFAAMIANPADLLGPRTMTPRSGEARSSGWDKFKKGESTITQRQADERVQVEGN
jgi:pilus assembly protein CpaD